MYFDIGCNIGKWTLANIDKCDKIISIEASPNTFDKLNENCKDYLQQDDQKNKIVTLNYAVCSQRNEITFYEADSHELSTINIDWLTSPSSRFYNVGYKKIKCKTITIDKLIEIYGIPELIKIDVEGGEYECIKSLTKKVKMICFEWASETNEISYQCLDYLFNLGFRYFYIQTQDNYTFRPNENSFDDIVTTKIKLSNTKPKEDWGMLWCK